MVQILMSMERTMATRALRQFLMWIDWVVYWLVSVLTQAVFDIASFNLSDEIFQSLFDRVYLILTIFMMFKIIISLISYMVNPDSMNDKNQGVGKLVSKILVVLVMLALVPTLFNTLSRLQGPMLRTLPRIIIGRDSDNANSHGVIDMGKNGKYISGSIFSTFFDYNKDSTCGNTESTAYSTSNPGEINLKSSSTTKSSEFMDIAMENVNEPCPSDGAQYMYDYTPFISTLAGLLMGWVLLSITITIGVRMFKLIILRLVAPIPIISYIGPRASKDSPFNKWIKLTVKTWLDLFINLGITYFVIFLITDVVLASGGDFANYVSGLGIGRGTFFLVFVVLGLFMFAKQAPKFICDALGIKSENMGEFGKIITGGMIGGLVASGAGAIGSGIASGRASYMADEANEKGHGGLNIAKNIGAGLFGGIGGLATGINAATSKDGNARKAREAMAKRNSTVLAQGSSGSTWWGRTQSSMSNLFTGETIAGREQRRIDDMGVEISNMESQKADLASIDSRVKGEMVKQDWTVGSFGVSEDSYGRKIENVNYKDFYSRMQAAKTAGQNDVEFYSKDANGNETLVTVDMVTAEKQVGFLQKTNEANYYNEVVIEHHQTDNVLQGMYDEAVAQGVDSQYLTGRDGYKKGQEKLTADITTQKRQKVEAERANKRNKSNDRFSNLK